MIRRAILGVAIAALPLLAGCDRGTVRPQPGVTASEMETIRRWLSCEECDQGERQGLSGMGARAIPILTQALDTGSAGGRALFAALEASVEGQLALLPDDSTTDATIRFFTHNELGRVQERAAATLGDLGAVAEIQQALDERGARGLDDAVVRALESALLRASPGASPQVVRVVVVPGSVEMEEGNSMTLSALTFDTVGSALQGEAVTWTLAPPAGTGAVSLDSAGALTALAPGLDTVVATHASGSTGRVTVRVVPRSTLAVLRIVSGDHQSATVGAVLPAPVVVQATTGGGAPAPGVPVAWDVASGGGALLGPDAATDAAGRARARWRLGDTVGPQRARVSGPDGLRIAIRAQGAPRTTIQGVIVNDRDGDGNVIDPDEALAGVAVSLYKDLSPPVPVGPDSLVATDTTDAAGAFRFTGLPAGTYIVRPVGGTPPGRPVRVLRSESNGDTAVVRTAGPEAPPGSGNPDATLVPGTGGRTVGITSGFGGSLTPPRWDNDNGVLNLKGSLAPHRQPHFTFLFTDGTATGRVVRAGSGLAGVTVSAARCTTARSYTSPPTVTTDSALACVRSGPAMLVNTDAAGRFSFAGVSEGVWQVSVDPAPAGFPGPVMFALYVFVGAADVESVDFIVP